MRSVHGLTACPVGITVNVINPGANGTRRMGQDQLDELLMALGQVSAPCDRARPIRFRCPTKAGGSQVS
jgi:NAD(P)-dependent dehydrogenase (short-subunit alcohol dehydrogenase family)